MLPYLIAGAIGFGIGKLFEEGGEAGEKYVNGGGIGEYKMYKLRAEGLNDFLNFLGTGVYFNVKSFTVEPIGVPDVVVSFETNLSLSEIKAKLREVQDSHVMLETIKPIKEYTGERYAGGGGTFMAGGRAGKNYYWIRMDRNKIDEYIGYASRMYGMFEGQIYTQAPNKVAFDSQNDMFAFTSMIDNHNNDNDFQEGDEGYIHYEELFNGEPRPNIFDRIIGGKYAGGGEITDADLNYYIYPTKEVKIAYLGKIQMGYFFSLKDALKEIEYLTMAYPKNEIEKYAIITPDKTFHLGEKEYNIRFDNGGEADDKYGGQRNKIVTELKGMKGGLNNKAPYVFLKEGYIYVSAENGDNYADYYEYTIDEKLEDLADRYNTYWDWETAGSIVLAPIDTYAGGGEAGEKYILRRGTPIRKNIRKKRPKTREPKMVRTIFEEEYFKDFDNGGEVYALVDKFDENRQDYDQLYFKTENYDEIIGYIADLKNEGEYDSDMQLIEVSLNGKMRKFDSSMLSNGGEAGKTSNLSSVKRKYLKNENENAHSENVVLLAENFGDSEDLKFAKEILKLHNTEGYLSTENGKKRQELHLKLIKIARKKFGQEGIEFANGGEAKKRRRSASIQYGRSDTAVDKTRVGKPVGYRFSNAKANQLRKDPYAKPTEAQVKKYLGKGIYKENRKNRSDRDRNEKL